MTSPARLSPTTRGVVDIEARIRRLQEYENWREPIRINFAAIISPQMWQRHEENWKNVVSLLRTSQELASQIRVEVRNAITAKQ